METGKLSSSRLFIITAIEGKDELDEKYDKCYNFLQNLIGDVSEKEAHDLLISVVCKGPQNHEEISLGLLSSILSNSENASRFYRDLTFITQDGLNLIVNHLTQLILEKYHKLLPKVQEQLIWIIKEMIKASVPGTDGLCYNLMRQIAGGDLSSQNLWLIEAIIDIYIENRVWLEKFPLLIPSVVYTYLRLLEDHLNPAVVALRQKEVNFVIQLLRDKFTDCIVIGRDLVRLLQNVARIPEFEQFWQDLLYNSSSLNSGFNGILDLLQCRTPRRFFLSRLTPDMEKKIFFLTSQVRFGCQKKYQEWFQRQYLSTPESQSLRCDLIRYIVGVIHPSNELLCSDIIPRWAVIGWLLTACSSNVAAANAKLALFYDWLYFDPEKDNIMNIEPAILLMHHSMRSHPAITATLLDFLCRILMQFCPSWMEHIKQGVHNALHQILEKRVLPSLSPLLDNNKLDKELQQLLHEHFSLFLTSGDVQPEEDASHVCDISLEEKSNHFSLSDEPSFSDEEEETELHIKTTDIDNDFKNFNSNISEQIALLESPFCQLVMQLFQEPDNNNRCEIMEHLLSSLIEKNDSSKILSIILCDILQLNVHPFKILPQDLDEEILDESIIWYISETFENGGQCRSSSFASVNSRYALQSASYWLSSDIFSPCNVSAVLGNCWQSCCRKLHMSGVMLYEELCRRRQPKELNKCLVQDMEVCQEDDVSLFFWLLPFVFINFPQIAIGNIQLLHTVVSCIDAAQLQELACTVLSGQICILNSECVMPVLTASLEWDTFEQMCLWELIAAHNISTDNLLPLLPQLKYPDNAEPLLALLLRLKQECPTADIFKQFLNRDVTPRDNTFVTLLQHWSQEHEGILIELLISNLSRGSPTKRKRSNLSNRNVTLLPSVELVLTHLDMYRNLSPKPNLLNNENLIQALQTTQQQCSLPQKKRFQELFSFIEETETRLTKNSVGRSSRKMTSKTSRRNGPCSDSDSEEEVIKARTTKKRRKTNLMGSDSD